MKLMGRKTDFQKSMGIMMLRERAKRMGKGREKRKSFAPLAMAKRKPKAKAMGIPMSRG